MICRICSGLAALAVGALMLGYPMSPLASEYVLDSTDYQYLRVDHSTDADIIRTLYPYEDVVLSHAEYVGGTMWYQVGYANSGNYQSLGWITDSWQDNTDGGYAKDYLNVREYPSTDADIIYTLSPNQYAPSYGERLASVAGNRDWWGGIVVPGWDVGYVCGYWFDADRED